VLAVEGSGDQAVAEAVLAELAEVAAMVVLEVLDKS